ncbi:hypothetical protein DL93DRAFT_2079469 [Clavulina sp. PMI_390]|nr:hypothetical protein DL93DRAFT_2079469 [Clavulina sp. PMI_390]
MASSPLAVLCQTCNPISSCLTYQIDRISPCKRFELYISLSLLIIAILTINCSLSFSFADHSSRC